MFTTYIYIYNANYIIYLHVNNGIWMKVHYNTIDIMISNWYEKLSIHKNFIKHFETT